MARLLCVLRYSRKDRHLVPKMKVTWKSWSSAVVKFLNKISAKIAKLRKKYSKDVDNLISLDISAKIGGIPTAVAGGGGHAVVVDAFFEILSSLKPDVFCDIGANMGEAGQRAKIQLEGIHVFSFEANPRIHKIFEQQNVEKGLSWNNLAVSDREGKLSLYIPRVLERALEKGEFVAKRVSESNVTGKSSLLKRDEKAEYDVVEVDTIRLDNFLASHAPSGRVALWIDVEGAASLVLDGAPETLDRCDVLIIETEGFSFWKEQVLADQTIERLQMQGFEAVARDREYQDAQFNIIFVRGSVPNFSEIMSIISHKLSNQAVTSAAIIRPSAKANWPDVPMLIPCFNNPAYCKQMVDQLLKIGCTNISLIDNASTFGPMLDFLENVEGGSVRVDRLTENMGPRKSIFGNDRLKNIGRYFCVTDPDIEFNKALPANFLEIMAEEMEKENIGKIGFALDIGNNCKLKQEPFDIDGTAYTVWQWEKQFWNNRVGFTRFGDPIYSAAVDTTFALYDSEVFDYRYDDSPASLKKLLASLRIGGRFTAQHLPWLVEPTLSNTEAEAYRSSQKFSYYTR
jgi:FkbM family methyltransferase